MLFTQKWSPMSFDISRWVQLVPEWVGQQFYRHGLFCASQVGFLRAKRCWCMTNIWLLSHGQLEYTSRIRGFPLPLYKVSWIDTLGSQYQRKRTANNGSQAFFFFFFYLPLDPPLWLPLCFNLLRETLYGELGGKYRMCQLRNGRQSLTLLSLLRTV